jgi:hypothetical protein
MTVRTILSMMSLTAVCLLAPASRAAVTAREETAGVRRLMVLENDQVRLAVAPDPGGTVVSFVHKASGTEFVYGGSNVLAGKLGGGWKDYYALEALDQFGKGVYGLPYKGEFRDRPEGKSIVVSCEAEGQRFEREMRLADGSPELATRVKITNIGDTPRRLQIRWHTYSTLDDRLASNSCVVSAGPGGEARKVFIGSGWDHQMITADGYWMAANYKSGVGLWMTFKKEQSSLHMTWTDYKPNGKTAARGAFVAEPYPQPILAQPGASVEYESTVTPFTAADAPESLPLGVLSDAAEKDRARRFLAAVKPNLESIGPYTMTPGDPPSGLNKKPGENRFDFSHRRRDRFALRDWGFLDAMMAVAGDQAQAIRCRYYARLFDGMKKPMKVVFRLRIFDALDRPVREWEQRYTLDPARAREVDVRDDVAIGDLADGWHRFVLEGYVDGERDPIHVYSESRRLVGKARPAFEKQAADKAAAPLVERPFVTALRTVELPVAEKGGVAALIGVEEGGGLARAGWPARCGVPFAPGAVRTNAVFRLAGPDGKGVPIQTAPMATWLDGSLKWLLVDFPATAPSNGFSFFTLRGGADAGSVIVEPPLATPKDGAFLINGVSYGADDAKLFGLFGPEDLWWADSAGVRYHFRLSGEGAGYELAENGPLRAALKATGWYVNAAGRPVCMGELRLECYRGQSFVKILHTVTYAGDPWKESLGSYGLRVRLPTNRFETASVELDGRPISGRQISLFQRNSDGVSLTVDGAASTGGRAIGAVALAGKGRPAQAVYLRDFWRMAPKKLEADAAAGTVTFSYWPDEAGAMSFLPREDGWIPSSSSAEAIAVGLSRAHEIVVDLSATSAVTDFERLHGEPVVAVTPPRYLTSTRAMLHLAPYDPGSRPKLERVISDTVDFFQAQRELFGWYGEWEYGGIPNLWRAAEYRWAEFGRYGWILNEEDIADAPWLCFLRSGDRKYLKFAESNTRHLMEVGTIRWNPVWPRYVGLSRRHHECIWLSGGDYGHSMLDPFVDFYHATGYRPAWEAAERMAGAMAKVTSGQWRYISNPCAGLSRMYLETQNPFYKEQADRIWNTLCFPEKNDWWLGNHGDRMVLWYSQLNPQCKELWKAWSLNPQKKDVYSNHPRLGGVDALAALYLETGETKYAEAVEKAVPGARPAAVGLTQSALAGLRAWCYAGEAADAAGPASPDPPALPAD